MFPYIPQFMSASQYHEGLVFQGFNLANIAAARVRIQVLEGAARELQANHLRVPANVLDEITGLQTLIRSFDSTSQLQSHARRGGVVFQTGLGAIPRHPVPLVWPFDFAF